MSDELLEDMYLFNDPLSFRAVSVDPPANIPLAYSGRPNINKANIGGPAASHNLAFAGVSNVNAGSTLNPALPTDYTRTDANVTPSGHMIEYNDTPGGERIRFKHRSGAGIDMLPDGSIAIAVKGKHVLTVMDDATVVIMGNANYEFNGDLNFNVKGDFNLKCTNFNTEVAGNKTDNITGALRETIGTNRGETIKGNHSVTTLGSHTSTIVGNHSLVAKGTSNMAAQGKMQILGGGAMKVSAQGGFDLSSTNINIAGNSTTVIGNSGTMGGENVHLYGFNARLTESVFAKAMQADTFHGDLDGTAAFAQKADQANLAAALPGPSNTIPALTNTAVNGTSTALPNGTLMNQYLNVSSKGIINVTIDEKEIIKMIDRSQFNGGTSSGNLSTTQVRSRLRDEANLGNAEFCSNMVASGVLSPQYSQTAAPGIGRTVGRAPTPVRGSTPIGGGATDQSQRVFQPAAPATQRRFIPNLNYMIKSTTTVNPSTLLAKGVPLSMFISGEGDRANINHITDMNQRRQIARNLQVQAQILLYVNGSPRSQFVNTTLKVIEGIYKPGAAETVTPEGLNDLAMQGRCVVYELINNDTGKVDPALTFELATALKNIAMYDKLILDYDNYNPDGSMNVQLIVTSPQMSETYQGTFKYEIETRYNNKVQSAELVEITTAPSGGNAGGGASGAATAPPPGFDRAGFDSVTNGGAPNPLVQQPPTSRPQ